MSRALPLLLNGLLLDELLVNDRRDVALGAWLTDGMLTEPALYAGR